MMERPFDLQVAKAYWLLVAHHFDGLLEKLKTEFYSYVINVALSKDSGIELDDTIKIRVARKRNTA